MALGPITDRKAPLSSRHLWSPEPPVCYTPHNQPRLKKSSFIHADHFFYKCWPSLPQHLDLAVFLIPSLFLTKKKLLFVYFVCPSKALRQSTMSGIISTVRRESFGPLFFGHLNKLSMTVTVTVHYNMIFLNTRAGVTCSCLTAHHWVYMCNMAARSFLYHTGCQHDYVTTCF